MRRDHHRLTRRAALTGLAASMAAGSVIPPLARPAIAQSAWPNRPVRLIVPYAAGGGTDTLARPWSEKLQQAFGPAFVIDNRGGASGTIGAEAAARSAPDGYTFLFTPNSALNVLPQLRKVAYDAKKDFLPVGRAGDLVGAFAMHPALGIKSMAEAIAYAKANPGKLSYASSGLGTSTHMRIEMVKLKAGVDILHVPYRGGGDALTDVLAGNVHIMNDIVVYPHAKAGKLNLLAISHQRRNPDFPDVLTLTEAGYPNSDVPIWFSIWAPAGTPAEIITIFNRKMAEIIASPDMQKRAREISIALPEGRNSAADLMTFYEADTADNTKLIREAKLSLS